MEHKREISKDGRQWKEVTLISVLPLAKNTRYILCIRNLVIFGFRNLKEAKSYRRRLKNDLQKVGFVMKLAGYGLELFLVRDTRKPPHEMNAIDAEYEVIQ